ncbi:MAG: radical SAM protein [Desulfobacterales bacterium]|nr:radical SAM protein [Desulfobacterales bacterium]
MQTKLFIDFIKNILNKKLPGQLVIQMTDHCNARCPQCGMRITEKFKRSKISNDDLKKIIDAAASKGVNVLSFTGGEPLLFIDELVDLIKYAGSAGIQFIRTGTNGFIFRNSEDEIKKIAEKLASTPLRNFWISVDSLCTDTHEEMRGFKGVIKGIEKAIPIFHENGLYPSINLGVNRNVGGSATSSIKHEDYSDHKDYLDAFYNAFYKSLQNFYQFAINMGFTILNTCYPMSIEETDFKADDDLQAVYKATSHEKVVKFDKNEKALLFKALFNVTLEFRSKIRIFSPLVSLYSLGRQYTNGHKSYSCRGGKDFFFIDAGSSNTFPCGYRGNDNYGYFWEMNHSQDKENCFQCDWECFRDPSEMIGPLLDIFSKPHNFFLKIINDPIYLKLWIKDLRYYKSCSFFDGRVPLNSWAIKNY